MQDETVEIAPEVLQGELEKLQNLGAIEYVVSTDPLGDHWIVGMEGNLVKMNPRDVVAFLMGVTVASNCIAKKT